MSDGSDNNPFPARPEMVRSIAIVSFICMLLVGLVWGTTKSRVQQQQQLYTENQLKAVLAGIRFDNDLVEDKITLRSQHSVTTVYRARLQQTPVGAVFETETPHGYNGAIRLLVGVDSNQTIAGVRVLSHAETPGLGDLIELEKSDWILGFDQLSLETTQPRDWELKRNGGRFDQFSGATITPRAMVNRIHDILLLNKQMGDLVFDLPSDHEHKL